MSNKFLAGLGDWYLGKTGYKSQMRVQPRDPNQPDNLFAPADATKDYGAHGAFDQRSIDRSYVLWATQRKGIIASALAGIAGATLAGSFFALGRDKD